MSFCTRCGSQIPEGAKFCTRCGQKVAAFTPAPQQTPVMPVPETAAPAPQPVYEAPAPQPVYEAPAPQPVYEAPAPQPVYEAPAPQPVVIPPVTIPEPIYEAPAPQPEVIPAEPVCEAPISEPTPEPVYEAPAAPIYEAPAPVYEAPAPEAVPFPAYEAPQSTYTEPAPQAVPFPAYAAPATPKQPEPPVYQPPVYQAPQPPVYQPPVPKEAPANQNPYEVPWQKPSAPGEKKSGSKIGAIIACIVGGLAVVAAVVIGLILLLGGGKNDPNLGLYEAVSCDAYGMELGVDDEWIELKSGGKAVLKLMGEEYNCKWSLDGEDLTIKQAGDEYEGTLADGKLTIDFGSMVYTYEKEGGAPIVEKPTDGQELPAQVGTWTLIRAEGEDAMDEETVAMLQEMGIVVYLELREDGTGTVCIDEPHEITWEDNVLVADDGTEAAFALVDGELLLEIDGSTLIFAPGELEDIPVVEPMETEPAETLPPETEAEDEMKAIREYWEGEWYGWWIVWIGEGEYAEAEDTGWDSYARIEVYDDGTGHLLLWDSDTSADDPIAECDISFEDGLTDAGTMVSESGYFLDSELTYFDWYADPGSSVVDKFDHMIAINGTYVDPDNSENTMDYYIILRPWGMFWDDVYEADNSDTLYDNMMPFEYGNWYTPLLRAGVTQMPDSFEEGEALLEEAE